LYLRERAKKYGLEDPDPSDVSGNMDGSLGKGFPESASGSLDEDKKKGETPKTNTLQTQ